MLVLAKELVPEATIIEADMLDLSFPADTYDGVWANASLLHLTKVEMNQMVDKIQTFLKPGGHVYAHLKQGAGEKEITETKYHQPVNRFFAFYTQEELIDIFTRAGFKITQTFSDETETSKWVSVLAFKPGGSEK